MVRHPRVELDAVATRSLDQIAQASRLEGRGQAEARPQSFRRPPQEAGTLPVAERRVQQLARPSRPAWPPPGSRPVGLASQSTSPRAVARMASACGRCSGGISSFSVASSGSRTGTGPSRRPASTTPRDANARPRSLSAWRAPIRKAALPRSAGEMGRFAIMVMFLDWPQPPFATITVEASTGR